MTTMIEQKTDLKPLRIPKIKMLEKSGVHPTRLGQPAEQYDYTTKPDRLREIVEFFNYHDFAIIASAQKSFDKSNNKDDDPEKLLKLLQSGEPKIRLHAALQLLHFGLGKYQEVIVA